MANWSIKTMLKDKGISKLEISNINICDLVPNEKNFYDVKDTDDIQRQNEQLKASIKLFGILTPLLVKPNGDKYKIISGHRRWHCAVKLAADGSNKYDTLPCVIDDGIGGASAEEMKLILLNSTTRKRTDYELTMEISRLKSAINSYKADGHRLPCRVQDLIAETIGLSKSTVGRHETIDKNLIHDAKEGYKKGDIAMSTAAEMSSMSADDQKAVYEKTAGKPKLEDVKKKKAEPKKRTDESLPLDRQPEPEQCQLKPCPFCGGAAFIEVVPPHKDITGIANFMPDCEGEAFAECSGCACAMSADTKEEVIAKWNKRV